MACLLPQFRLLLGKESGLVEVSTQGIPGIRVRRTERIQLKEADPTANASDPDDRTIDDSHSPGLLGSSSVNVLGIRL
jgi:hypothetical protein